MRLAHLFSLLAIATLAQGCPSTEVTADAAVDAGPSVDAGVPTLCTGPADCRDAGLAAACRQGECRDDVPCGDDLECALGERCQRGQCRFTGCTRNADCATGKCLVASYSCVECGANADCPRERPVCDTGSNLCVQCRSDAECALPGPAHCSAAGACVACTANEHCPNGLTCSSGNLCVGVSEGGACPMGTSCGPGLACVNVGNSPLCLKSCNLYSPTTCTTGQICYKLTYQGSTSLVFEADGPIGVCFSSQQGARGLREPCARANGSSNCQPNLLCMPETASLSLCRGFCNPLASGTCAAGDHCVGFVGDYNGRKFGVCMPDTGFGATCQGDAQCRTGLTCQPWDDPSAVTELSTVCEFNVGTRPALAPCANQGLADGGVLAASRTCQSGVCAADPVTPSATTGAYFCLGACATDADCSVGGRSGVCDGTFDVVSAFDTAGTIKGCRPTCESPADCASYDAGVTCRVRALATGLVTTCSPAAGTLASGAPCTANSQCRSSLCSLEDARGVRRAGVCAEPCRATDVCASAALPQACAPSAVLLSRGPDGLPATSDDVVASPRLCAGAPCVVDADCQPDGGVARCVPDVAPTPAAGAVLRCRMPATGSLEGGAACALDGDCASGVCARVVATGAHACFQACAAGTPCPGSTSCRSAGVTVTARGLAVPFDACLP